MRGPLAAIFAVATACTASDLEPPPDVVRARFDPDAKVIPMPSDALRDDAAGRLDIPIDADTSPAEAELYGYLNTLDGWSSASAATVDFSGPIAPATVTADTVQVWRWGPTPRRVDDVTVTVADDERRVTLDAPRAGWDRGAQYYVVVRGGDAGVEGKAGQPVVADAAFYFLRQTTPLDDPAHNRAFPGATYAERADNARQLEVIRGELAPMFEHLAARGLARDEIAALWRFTVTTRAELAMDKPSQRMPIPIQLLIDPATGKVDLPPAPWDTAVEREAKHRLRAYDGFATSANLLFELTAPVDPATVSAATIELWQLGATPTRVPATARGLDDLHVVVTPTTLPLPERTAFALVVTDGVRDRDGHAIVAMPAGALLLAAAKVVDGGASTVGAVPLVDAVRIEDARGRLAALLAARGRDRVVAAWPFVTQTIAPRLDAMAGTAARDGHRERDLLDAVAAVLAPGPGGVVEEDRHRQRAAGDPLDVEQRRDRQREVEQRLARGPVADRDRIGRQPQARGRRPPRRAGRVHDDHPARGARRSAGAGGGVRPRRDDRAPVRAGHRRRARGQGLRGDRDRSAVPRHPDPVHRRRPHLRGRPAHRRPDVAAAVPGRHHLRRRRPLRRRQRRRQPAGAVAGAQLPGGLGRGLPRDRAHRQHQGSLRSGGDRAVGGGALAPGRRVAAGARRA